MITSQRKNFSIDDGKDTDSEFEVFSGRGNKEKNYQRWTIEENRSYAEFLEQNKAEF